MIKTASINAGATEQVVFDRIYPYFYIKNLSDSDVYAAIDKMSFSAGDDDVTCVPAQSCCIVYSTFASDTVNIKSDSDTAVIVEVIAAYDNNINFFKKNSSKGGGTYDDTAIKSDISNLQTGKADKSEVYTKSETDSKITSKVAEIVADAPEDFDTLKEMSDWIASHENSASAMNSAIQTNADNISNLQENKANASDLNNYVTKITGKGLSTNDYTTDDKNKLDSLENYDDTTVKNDIMINRSSIGMSKKNLLKNTAITKEKNGFTFTINDDGSITVNGPANESVNTDFPIGTIKTKNGVKYILSGCPQGGSSSSYRLNMRHEGQTTNVYPDTGKGVSFTGIEETMTVYILIYMNTEMNNVTFYPMIRYADITDDAYEPYTEDLQAQINNTIALNLSSIGMSRKNLLKNTATSTSPNKVTYTVNSNGSVTVTNTETTPGNATLNVNTNFKLNPGTYILTGDTEISKVGDLRISVNNSVYYTGTPFTLTETSTVSYVRIYVYQNRNLGGTATVYPMLRYADIIDDTYEPYQDDLQTQINAILTRLDSAGI